MAICCYGPIDKNIKITTGDSSGMKHSYGIIVALHSYGPI